MKQRKAALPVITAMAIATIGGVFAGCSKEEQPAQAPGATAIPASGEKKNPQEVQDFAKSKGYQIPAGAASGR